MPPVFLASFSRCCRQYVLSQPLGKTSNDIWPPMEKLCVEKTETVSHWLILTVQLGGGQGRKGETHVKPRCPKRSRSFSTNFSRTWCSLSYFS